MSLRAVGQHPRRLLLRDLLQLLRNASDAPRAKERRTQRTLDQPSLARGATRRHSPYGGDYV